MPEQPLVTAVIPTHNRRDYVLEAVDSVLRQTYTSLEVVVVDDGSTDGTDVAILERFGTHSQVRYIRQPNAERAVARNRGIAEARGELVAFLDSDDTWLPDKLARQVPCFDDPDVALSYSGVRCVHRDKGEVRDFVRPAVDAETTGRIFGHLVYTNVVGGASTPVARRASLVAVGGFDVDRRLIPFAEDWALWIRLAHLGKVAFVAEALAVHNLHAGNTEQPTPARVYSLLVRKLLRYVDVKDAGIVREAAEKRYRWMIASELHVGRVRAAVNLYLWGLMTLGVQMPRYDLVTWLWRAKRRIARVR